MSDVAMFCLYRYYTVNRAGRYWESGAYQYTLVSTKRLYDDASL